MSSWLALLPYDFGVERLADVDLSKALGRERVKFFCTTSCGVRAEQPLALVRHIVEKLWASPSLLFLFRLLDGFPQPVSKSGHAAVSHDLARFAI